MADPSVVSTRSLVDSEFGTPLRRFYGDLENYYIDEGGSFGARVVLQFANIQVLETAPGEVYNFPTAQLSIKLSNRKKSGWGIFGESLNKLIPENEDIKDQKGKRMGLALKTGIEYGTSPDGTKMIGSAWEAFEVAGVVAGAGSSTAVDEAKKLLDGKNRADFNQAAYANPIIRKDPEFQRAITDKSFLNSMLQLGEFTEDANGVFHRA